MDGGTVLTLWKRGPVVGYRYTCDSCGDPVEDELPLEEKAPDVQSVLESLDGGMLGQALPRLAGLMGTDMDVSGPQLARQLEQFEIPIPLVGATLTGPDCP